MTPKERAKEATESAGLEQWGSDDQGQLELAVEQAIIAAVEEEREACAKIADEEAAPPAKPGVLVFMDGYQQAAGLIAHQIRARGNNEGGTR